MHSRILAAILFVCATVCSLNVLSVAQNLEVLNPPMSSSAPGYTDLFNHILNQSHVKGITTFLQWGSIDTGTNSPCTETTCQWTATDAVLRAYIGGVTPGGLSSHPGQKLNLVINITPESNGPLSTTNIPAYVFNPNTYNVAPTAPGWCPGCAAQDMATCGLWHGDSNAPTCTASSGNSCTKGDDGVWNANTCHLSETGFASNNCENHNYSDISGFPVLYEKPLMTAYQQFVKTVINHYRSGSGNDIGAYIGYIRVGLAEGGENQPICTVRGDNSGIWPSPEGLSYDLASQNTANPVTPDWYITNTTCTGDPNCQGKFAYIAGNAGSQHDGPGYVATMFSSFYTALQNSGAPWQIMANIHTGPPNNEDTDYPYREAPIFLGVTGPPCQGDCSSTGFGQETLQESDLRYNPSNPPQAPCGDLWCYLFGQYQGSTGGTPNFYLQTTEPNNAVTYSIASVQKTQAYPNGIVTCNGTCTNYPSGLPADPGQSPMGLYAQEGFAFSTGSGPNKTAYKIAQQRYDSNNNPIAGILSVNSFSCDASTPCPANPQPQTLYVGDFLPDTIPFAAANYAQTIEVYFCDWEFAYNNLNSTSFCQGRDDANSQLYRNVLGAY
jgi:hypothetical protein